MPDEYRTDADGFISIDGTASVDPSEITATAPADEPRKRRTRSDAGQPRGPRGPRKGKEKAEVDLTSLTGMFIGLHAGIAMLAKEEVWLLSEQEGTEFMKAAQNVARHYSVTATQKTIDIIAFAGITTQIYGLRLGAIWAKKRKEQQPRPRPATVHPFPQQPVQPAQQQAPPQYVPSVVQPDYPDEAG